MTFEKNGKPNSDQTGDVCVCPAADRMYGFERMASITELVFGPWTKLCWANSASSSRPCLSSSRAGGRGVSSSVPICPFFSFLGFARSSRDFPIVSGFFRFVPFLFLGLVKRPTTQWARRDRLMSRGRNCRETIFASHLSRNYPHRGVDFERG